MNVANIKKSVVRDFSNIFEMNSTTENGLIPARVAYHY